MGKKYFTAETKIALTAIIALILLFLGLNFLKGIDLFKTTNHYYVEFPNIMGLTKSSPVYANGYAVGSVRNINYNYKNPGHVIVCVELDKEMQIPNGSTAEIETEMLGAVKMSLILSDNPLKHMNPGDTIVGKLHDGALNKVESMLPAIEKIVPKIDSIITSINLLLSNPALTATINNTKDITDNLKKTTKQINNLLGNDIPRLTERMDRIGKNAEAITENLKGLDIEKTMSQVNTTLESVNTMTNTLNNRLSSPDNTLGLLLNDATLYQNMSATMESANNLLLDLKSHPKRYVHFSIFGKKDK